MSLCDYIDQWKCLSVQAPPASGMLKSFCPNDGILWCYMAWRHAVLSHDALTSDHRPWFCIIELDLDMVQLDIHVKFLVHVSNGLPWECWLTDTQTGPILLPRPLTREVISGWCMYTGILSQCVDHGSSQRTPLLSIISKYKAWKGRTLLTRTRRHGTFSLLWHPPTSTELVQRILEMMARLVLHKHVLQHAATKHTSQVWRGTVKPDRVN